MPEHLTWLWTVAPGAPPAYDLADEDLTLFLEAPYAGGTWSGNASAGTSGAHALTAGTAPDTGTTLNGFAVAGFSAAATKWLEDVVDSWADIVTASTYTLFGLIYLDSVVAAAAGYVEAAILTSPSGEFGLTASSGGIGMFNNGDVSYVPVRQACATGGWRMFFVTYVGGTVSVAIDQVAPTTGARGVIASVTGAIKCGRNYAGAVYLDGKIASLCGSKLDLTASRANIRGYYNSKFALSL